MIANNNLVNPIQYSKALLLFPLLFYTPFGASPAFQALRFATFLKTAQCTLMQNIIFEKKNLLIIFFLISELSHFIFFIFIIYLFKFFF